MWREFFDHVEGQSGRDGELWPVRDFAAKAAEHAARIAGVITIVEDLQATEIGAGAMKSALALMNWYLAEALRLQVGARRDPKLLRAKALREWLKERGEVSFRDIMRLGPNPLRTKAACEEALTILAAHAWIVEVSARPRRVRLVREGSGS